MRIAMLAHSTNPRGGVVHAMAVAEALQAMGHEAVLHAPAEPGRPFLRPAACATRIVPAAPAAGALRARVEQRIADYVAYFTPQANRDFDIFHAQDGISANALATLTAQGHIPGFLRTVHHIDQFDDPGLMALQDHSIRQAAGHFTVSRQWLHRLAQDFGFASTVIGNGVDRAAFTPLPSPADATLRRRLGLGGGPAFLAVGGIEARKNTLGILRGFARLLPRHPNAQLVIAGGVSLLDHSAYQAAFHAELRDLGIAHRVILAGAIPQPDMPGLYRACDALAFPSLEEGFGLVALEAMACGRPVITAAIPPFTEHFGPDDVLWCDPHAPASITEAMHRALDPPTRARLTNRAPQVLAPHDWRHVAAAHLPAYAATLERQDA